MSYIAFDLDAFDAAESAARHAGASADAMMAGLLRLWRFCWRQRNDVVTPDQLRGVFGIDVGPALVAFGFVAQVGSNYRVRGADRYLRIQEGRSRGGKAASGNLKQNKKKPAEPAGSPPADLRLGSGSTPADDRLTHRLDSGLSPTSEQRLATSEQRILQAPAKKPREAKPKKPPDPRLGPIIGRLKAAFESVTSKRYEPSDPDVAALRGLLSKGDDDEIHARFVRGLKAGPFDAKCATFLQLAQRWNELAVERRTGTQPELRATATASNCAACGSPAGADLADGIPGCYPCISAFQAWCDSTAQPEPWKVAAQWAESQRNGVAA